MANSSGDGSVFHFGLIRLRVKGSGSLISRFVSLDDVYEDILNPFTMAPVTSVEPTILANFNQQRAYLEIKTIAINETFQISKIVIFSKPTASSYPM